LATAPQSFKINQSTELIQGDFNLQLKPSHDPFWAWCRRPVRCGVTAPSAHPQSRQPQPPAYAAENVLLQTMEIVGLVPDRYQAQPFVTLLWDTKMAQWWAQHRNPIIYCSTKSVIILGFILPSSLPLHIPPTHRKHGKQSPGISLNRALSGGDKAIGPDSQLHESKKMPKS